MARNRFKNKAVAVLGLGREGLDAVNLMLALGAKVTILDKQEKIKKTPEVMELVQRGVELQLGWKYLQDLHRFKVIVRSPGVPLDLPELKYAAKKGVELTSAIKLFFELSPTKNIVGVTGTKGKSTVSSLIYHLLKPYFSKVYLAGNIGASPSPLLSKLKPSDWVILELSSFQLEDLNTSPHIAVWLQVAPEHLDRHKTFAKYLAAKQNIFKYQRKRDWLIAAKDFPATRNVLKTSKAQTLPVSGQQILQRGVYISGDEMIYRRTTLSRQVKLGRLKKLPLLGKHNLYNMLVAVGAGIVAGAPADKLVKRLQSFKPLKHRLELVRTKGKVSFINDSLSTTPVSVMAAIESLDGPKAMILGGVSKGSDEEEMIKMIKASEVVHVALIGQSAKRLAKLFKKIAPKVSVKMYPTLLTAVKGAYIAVKSGGVVLFSPGYASFDMFKNAYDRGEQFSRIANKL